MELDMEFGTPFSGIVYADAFYHTPNCRWEGTGARRLIVSIPLNTNPSAEPYCGVKLSQNGNEFATTVVISPMKGLLVDGMAGLTVRCVYRTNDITLTMPVGANGAGIRIRYPNIMYSSDGQGGVITGSGGNPFLQMVIRDGHGLDGPVIHAANVGQRITLDIFMQDTAIYDFYVHNCFAHDGSRKPDASVTMIDSDGCAVSLSRAVEAPVFTSAAEANSAKHVFVHMYGFQFTTSQLVYFECQVKPCLQSCTRPQCEGTRHKRDSSLAKIAESPLRTQTSVVQNSTGPSGDYNLTAIIRISNPQLNDIIPAAAVGENVQTAGVPGGQLCIQSKAAIGILVIFVVVCVVSLAIAVIMCRKTRRDAKLSSAYLTPTSTPSQPHSAAPSPLNRHRFSFARRV